MEEWVIDSSAGIVPVYILVLVPRVAPFASLPSHLPSFFFFSSSPRHVSPRIVVRGSWMPDDYIDRVGGWSEASKVAANFAIRRNTTSTKKYLLLGRGSRPLIPFSPEPRQIFPIAPGNKSRVDFPLPLVPSSRKIMNNSLFLPTRYFSRKKCSRIDGSTHPGYTLFKFALY